MNGRHKLELCIVMPAYNEEGCIEKVVREWLGLLDRLAFPAAFVIVNDGSKDGTGKVLDQLAGQDQRLAVIHQANAGHGAALLRGYREALTRAPAWVFQVDSDDQFLPEDFQLLWERRAASRFIMGRRKQRHDPPARLVITRILKLLNTFLFGRYLADANIPFRLIQGEYLGMLLEVIPPDVFAPNIFLAVTAACDGQDLGEIPVRHKERETGSISIIRLKLLKVCLRCARELWVFRSGLKDSLQRLAVLRSRQAST